MDKDIYKKLSLMTLLFCIKSEDTELSMFASAEIDNRYSGKSKEIKDLLFCKNQIAMSEKAKKIEWDISEKEKKELLEDAAFLLSYKDEVTIPMEAVCELLKSRDDYLVEKAKEFACSKIKYYLFWIIHNVYKDSTGSNIDELYNNGIIGVLSALDKYDTDCGLFTTFCNPYIQHALSGHITYETKENSNHYAKLQKKIKEAIDYLQENDYPVNVINLSIETGLKTEVVKRELDIYQQAVMVNWELIENTEFELSYQGNPERIVEQNERKKKLAYALINLQETEYQVIMMKYDQKITTDEIAKRLDIPTSKVKHICQKALRQLRFDNNLSTEYRDRQEYGTIRDGCWEAKPHISSAKISEMDSPLIQALERSNQIMEVIDDVNMDPEIERFLFEL